MKKKNSRAHKIALLEQKFLGLLLTILSILSIPVFDMDATAAILLIPVGLTALFSTRLLTEI